MTANEMALMANIAVDMQEKEVNEVLDKIRAEIEKKMDEPEYQHEGDDWGVGLEMALEIIDKYKVESE